MSVKKTLSVFSNQELLLANDLLSAKVSTMLGRKMEEDDWDFVYCNSKKIPQATWSNLGIDVKHNGVGIEQKMLKINNSSPIKDACGTRKMHPAGTRSIRVDSGWEPDYALKSVLEQYCELVDSRALEVAKSTGACVDEVEMRIGWLLWKQKLDEFLYFEQVMDKPDFRDYYAVWQRNPARGARKASSSLWIYHKETGVKQFSVTTDAGAKIQPYFEIPPADDPNLYHFKVQGVTEGGDLVKVWMTKSTANYLSMLVGSFDSEVVSKAILDFDWSSVESGKNDFVSPRDIAMPLYVSEKAYKKLKLHYGEVSDEYLFQQFSLDFGVVKK